MNHEVAELMRRLKIAEDGKRQAEDEKRQAEKRARQAEDEKRQAEDEKRQAEERAQQAEDGKQQAEVEKRRAEDEKRQAEDEKRRTERINGDLFAALVTSAGKSMAKKTNGEVLSESSSGVGTPSELLFNKQRLDDGAAMDLYRVLDQGEGWASWIAPYREERQGGAYVISEGAYSRAFVEKLRSCRSLDQDRARQCGEAYLDWFDCGDRPFDSSVSGEKPDCLLALRGCEVEASWATACAVLEFKSDAFGEKGQLLVPGHEALGQLFARRHRLHTPVFIGAIVDRFRVLFVCIKRKGGEFSSPVKLSSPPPNVLAQEVVNLEIASNYDCLFWPAEGPLSLLREAGQGEGELCGMEVLLGMRSQLKGDAFGLEFSEAWQNFAANLRGVEPEYPVLRPLSRIGSRRRDGRAVGRYVILMRRQVDDGISPCIIAKCWTEEERRLFLNEARVLEKLENVHSVPRLVQNLLPKGILLLSFGGRRTLHRQFQTSMTMASKIRALGKVREILESVHAAGFVHGDVKPENIVFADSHSPMLIDFEHAVGRGEKISGYTPAFCAQEIFDWRQNGEVEENRPHAKSEHDWESFFYVCVKELTKEVALLRSHFLNSVDSGDFSVFSNLEPSNIEIVRRFLGELRPFF